MAKDYFAEEIEKPSKDFFAEEVEKPSFAPRIPQRFFSPRLQVAQPAIQFGFEKAPEQAQEIGRGVLGALPVAGQIGADVLARKALGALPLPPKLKRLLYATSGVVGAVTGERGRQIGLELIGEGLLPEEAGRKILQTGKTAATIEALGWGLEKVLSPLWRITGGKLPFIKKLRGSFLQAKQRAGNKFAAGLKTIERTNPTARVDLSRQILEMSDDIFGNPTKNIVGDKSILSIIRSGQRKVGSNLFEQVLQNPELAKTLTLEQARILRQTIEKSPQIASNLAKGRFANWQPAHMNILDYVDDIKSSIADTFPDLKGVNANYSQFINKYNQVKNYMRTGKLSGALDKGLREVEIWKDFVKPLLKDNPQMLRELTSYFRTTTTAKIAGGGILASGLLYGARRMIGRAAFGGGGTE